MQKNINTNLDGRSIFLKEFVRTLIVNSKPKSSLSRETIERIRKRVEEDMPQSTNKVQIKHTFDSLQGNDRLKIARPSIMREQSRKFPIRPIMQRRMPINMQRPFLKPVQSNLQKPIESDMQSLSKIVPFLRDPSIIGVECPGAGKQLTINRSGRIQPVQISLSNDEVSAILNEFSSKTKVPLIPGIFKAFHNNLLMTATISDSTRSRFVIEKHFSTPSLPSQEKK